MSGESGSRTAAAVRIRVARSGGPVAGGTSELVSAFAGFLLGSAAGIIFRPPTITDEGTMVAYIVGGLVGAMVAAAAVSTAKRVLADRLGVRARSWAAAGIGILAAFVVGAIVGIVAQPMADTFLGVASGGNELLPAVVAAAILAVLTSLLFVILEEVVAVRASATSNPAGPKARAPWIAIAAGGLIGGVVGMLGGSMASAVTQIAEGHPGAEAGARGGLILAGWTGSLVGMLATAAFLGCAGLLRRMASRSRTQS